jgi:hypothetical protein
MLLPMFWTNILPQSCDVTCSSQILGNIYHTTQHQISFLQAVCFKDGKHIHRRSLFNKGVVLKIFFTCFLFSSPLLHTQSLTTVFTMFIFNYALQPFKAYCAIWLRHSNFCHQASPRVSPRKSTQQRKVELWGRNVR